jgi:hypothetical protein
MNGVFHAGKTIVNDHLDLRRQMMRGMLLVRQPLVAAARRQITDALAGIRHHKGLARVPFLCRNCRLPREISRFLPRVNLAPALWTTVSASMSTGVFG